MKRISQKMMQLSAFCFSIVMTIPSLALAFEPKPNELGLQAAASPRMERLMDFHDDLLMPIITVITIFVLALLIWVAIRFNKKANPKPSTTTHNVPLEVAWTAIPVIILIVISLESFNLLYYLDRTKESDMTLNVAGYQWGWQYDYPDHGIEEYRSDIIPDEELADYIPDNLGRRLLETYNPVVLPIGKNVTVNVTALPTDVIHSWAMPSLGVKKDAVPGRLSETWLHISEPGIYYGQCSEICGISHAYMPISIYGVPEDEFIAWTDCMKGEGADADYPARACVQKLNFDKYRQTRQSQELASLDGSEAGAE